MPILAAAAPAENAAAVADALKKLTTIATLPEVTAKIVTTVEDPKASAAQLHKIVAHDPALATRILKVVNSAFYGLPGQIGSVERAIVLLGLNAIKNIAVAASLGQLFRGVRLTGNYTAKDLWTHCIAVGVTARELARQMKLPIADEAFLAGLIHDAGLLVSLQLWPEKLRGACDAAAAAPERPFTEIEREWLGGVDHPQLGQGLAELWKFPRSCQMVAGYHHRPTALHDNNRLLVTLVYVADTMCCHAGKGFPLTALNQKIEDAGLSDINLDPVLIAQTANRLDDLVGSATSVLG
ncbi:MAG TPA: HDOD domain-containing protein [Tepidisphaeraceae bacterium]|nr:HDOD domain-containing protein [Tepidisphaeraceae bacterium]